ncbi:hypothetical protein ROHU_031106 [Labeo rohita]|uniref:Uncharacterized protein n=1 Tax=Labeo rohita TaxID=84645 RepID=A0A498LQS0_LABRO|nr:hypothetical protein ROHU_031106 [Labeo rohita]
MRRSDTTFSTHDLRAEGNVALREGHSKTAGASQRTRLVDLSSVQNLNFLKMTRFCLLSSPKADVKLQGSVQHFVSVEYALGRFELNEARKREVGQSAGVSVGGRIIGRVFQATRAARGEHEMMPYEGDE